MKYPNNTQFINWSNLFLLNFDLRINNWININDTLKINVVNPISIFVINAREYEIELIGVVPSVDIIENDTPRAIKNKPEVNNKILLNIFSHLF